MILYDIIVDLYHISQYLYVRCDFDMVQPYISIFIYVVQYNHISISYNYILIFIKKNIGCSLNFNAHNKDNIK